MEQYLSTIFRLTNCIGVLVTDGKGNIIEIEERNSNTYGKLSNEEILGKNVYDLERQGVFKPSVAAIVLATKKDATIVQELQGGQKVIVSAFPIFDGYRNIQKVVTFTRGIDEYIEYINSYEELQRKIDIYSEELGAIGYLESNKPFEVVTTSRELRQVLENARKVARYDISIVIEGETGVGKSLLAKMIHQNSNYSSGRFVEINCGALPEQLIESELFGYEKGAFTGANQQGKQGLIEMAAGGTVLLDEITELPKSAQVKLLQVLQQRKFRRVGGVRDIDVTCRFISATNHSMEDAVQEGKFRQDLMYRLNAFSCVIPPLRERPDDIIPLCKELLIRANKKHGTNRLFGHEVLKCMIDYPWPGNVREMENLVNRLVIIADGNIITLNDLPETIRTVKKDGTAGAVASGGAAGAAPSGGHIDMESIRDLNEEMSAHESEIINYFYAKEKTSVGLARRLNISQASAARKINKYVNK